MGCKSCGEKKKCTAKSFTKAVVEINNPEALVLLRKVSIPASMGTETEVPAAIGKYRNVVLRYEANKHTYIYSSDGIPTLLEAMIPDEIWERIKDLEDGLSELEQEFEDFKNSPDVVDIVATYADLAAYDTTSLGDKDIIRVLADETHSGKSAYYRWDKPNSQWIFIGTDSGGLDPATTFWGQTAVGNVVSGDIELGALHKIKQSDGTNTYADRIGFDAYGGFYLGGLVSGVNRFYIATPNVQQGTLETGYINVQNLNHPKGLNERDAATKGYVDSQTALTLTPFPDAIFSQILGGN